MKLLFLLLKAQVRKQWGLRLLLILSVALAVSAQVSLETFSKRIEATVRADTRSLLSADFQIQAYRDFEDKIFKTLDQMVGTENYLQQTDMLANARDDQGMSFNISLRALEKNYPFYGNFKTEPQLAISALKNTPLVLVEKSLQNKGYKLGDGLWIGKTHFQIAGFILEEPQTVASAFALGPRVILHQEWLKKAEILDQHSRAFRMLLVKSALVQEEFRKIFRSQVPEPHWRLITPDRANAQVSQVIERLRSFLAIVGLGAIFLGSIGIFMIFRSQFQLKLPEYLSLKCLGMPRSKLILYVIADGLWALLIGATLGVALGVGLEGLLSFGASKSLHLTLASVSYLPSIVLGFSISALTVFLGLLLPLVSTLNTPLAQVLRPQEKSRRVSFHGSTLLLIPAGIALIFIVARSFVLAGYFALGLILTSLLLILGTLVFFEGLHIFHKKFPFPIKQSFLGMLRTKSSSFLLILSLGLGIFLVTGILSISHTLQAQVKNSHLLGVPNFYILSIAPEQKEELAKILPPDTLYYPTTLARLKNLAGKDIVESADDNPDRGSFLRTREYNITRRLALAEGERLKGASTLFGPPEEGCVRASVEDKFAKRLGLKVGDYFTMSLSGVELRARIDSYREVNWFNFRPNFFIVFNEEDLLDAPMDFVAASRIEPALIDAKQREVSQSFPQLTSLNGESIAQRLISLLDRLAFATSSVGLFSLAASLFVFLGLILTQRPQLTQEVYLWRCLGVSKSKLKLKLFLDMGLPTLISIFTGFVSGLFFSFIISHFFLEIPFFFPSLKWILSITLTPLLVFPILGWYLIRGLTQESPASIFRNHVELV